MTDQSNGDVAPTATSSTTARSGLTPGAPAAQRAAEQDRLHTPPPRQRGVPPPRNPNATRRPDWTDKHTGEGKFLAAQDARRAEAAAADAPGSQTARDTGAAPDRGTGDAETKYKLGDNFEVTAEEARGLMERDALEKSRAATLPKDANEYELKLPDNFVAPQGVEFKLNPADPAVGQARAFALKHGLNQDGFSELVGIYGGMRVQEAAAFNRANQAEIEKLGATGTQRVTAIQNFLRGAIGDDLAKPFMQTLCTEAQVRGWEKLMQRVTGQGATGYSHAGRDPPKSRDDIPGYATMSFEQRRAAQERGAGRR